MNPPPTNIGTGRDIRLAIEPGRLDFGDVWEEEEFRHRLPITNRSSNSVQIANIQTSCGCARVSARNFSLGSSETAEIELTVDLTNRDVRDAQTATRRFEVEVAAIETRPIPRQTAWLLSGTVRSRLMVDAREIDFNSELVSQGTRIARTVGAEVVADGGTPVAEFDSEQLDVRISPVANQERRYAISVAVLPSVPPGHYQSSVRLFVVGADGTRSFGANLSVKGTCRPEIRLLPARIMFPPRSLGATAESIVTLNAAANLNVEIDSIESDSTDITIIPLDNLDLSKARTFRVRQKLSMVGDSVSQIRFRFRRDGGPFRVLVMEVCAHGL